MSSIFSLLYAIILNVVPADVSTLTIEAERATIRFTKQADGGWHVLELPEKDGGTIYVDGAKLTTKYKGKAHTEDVSRRLGVEPNTDWHKLETFKFGDARIGITHQADGLDFNFQEMRGDKEIKETWKVRWAVAATGAKPGSKTTPAQLEKALQRPVSMNLQNAPFGRGVMILESMAKLEIDVELEHLRDPATGLMKLPHVNLKASKMKARDVLDRMCAIAGVNWQIKDGRIVVQEAAKEPAKTPPPRAAQAPAPVAPSLARYEPAKTYAAVSIHWRAILDNMDFDDPLLSKLRELDNIDQWMFEDPKLARMFVFFSSQADEQTRSAGSAGTIIQFEAPTTPETFAEQMPVFGAVGSTQETYRGQQIHMYGKTGNRTSSTARFFPEKKVVASNTPSFTRQMIDGASIQSKRGALAAGLDPNAELHFRLMANDEMTTPMLISMFGQIEMLPAGLFGKAIEGVTRAELRLCNADKVPLQVTFEMKDDTSMDQLMKQIKVGLAEGPGLFDLIEKEEITSEEAARPPFLGLLTFCRNALKEMDIERNGRVLRMTLGHVEGLKELPQNYLASLMVLAAMSGP